MSMDCDGYADVLFDLIECRADRLGVTASVALSKIDDGYIVAVYFAETDPVSHGAEKIIDNLLDEATQLANDLEFTVRLDKQITKFGGVELFGFSKDKNFQNPIISDMISKFDASFIKNTMDEKKKRQRYRRRSELPDPEKSAASEANRRPRPDIDFKSRVKPEVADLVAEFLERSDMTKKALLEEALLRYILSDSPDIGEP